MKENTDEGMKCVYKLCKSEQSAARQKQLEQGLLQAMLTRPYEEISISDLCDQMNVPRKSFYRYFSNKDGALFALLDHTFIEYEQQTNPFLEKKGYNAIDELSQFFLFWYEHKNLLDALVKNRLSGMLVEHATSHALHERLMPAYLLQQDKTSQHLAMTFAICGLLAMVIQWHMEAYQNSVEEMAHIATMMLTKPLITRQK